MNLKIQGIYMILNILNNKCYVGSSKDIEIRKRQHCGESFDINDGGASSKWYPDTTICKQCSDEEDKEIEEDERWETINDEISNALYDLENEENLKSRLGEDNILKILKIAQKLN